MLAVAHDAKMNERVTTTNEAGVRVDQGCRRDLLAASAARGNPVAIKALAEPEIPEAIEYLLDWSRELVGHSGEGVNGPAALSWDTLDAWARRTGRNPTDAECRALMLLDTAIRHPEIVDAMREPERAD